MSNPTTPFSWQMPTATDLVTDLPADFEVFGQAVATSMADLLGGTTGQILAKNSATDMDFVWIANDQGDITGITATAPLTGGGTSGAITVGIQDALTTQKGAVQLSDSTSTTSSVLAATPTAVKSSYDLAAAAIPKSTVTTAGDTIYGTGSSAVSVNSVFSSTYSNYTVYFQLIAGGGGVHDIRMRASGSDNSNANTYVIQKLDFANTSVSTSRVTSNMFTDCFLVSADPAANKIDFWDPYKATKTNIEIESAINGQEAKISFGMQTNGTSFDGFSLLFDANVTGYIWIYGWKES